MYSHFCPARSFVLKLVLHDKIIIVFLSYILIFNYIFAGKNKANYLLKQVLHDKIIYFFFKHFKRKNI